MEWWHSLKNQKKHHIEMKYHLIHEIVLRRDVVVKKIGSMKNLKDPFTNTLSIRVFDGHKDNIGVKCLPNML